VNEYLGFSEHQFPVCRSLLNERQATIGPQDFVIVIPYRKAGNDNALKYFTGFFRQIEVNGAPLNLGHTVFRCMNRT
jgi:hypothetical protein